MQRPKLNKYWYKAAITRFNGKPSERAGALHASDEKDALEVLYAVSRNWDGWIDSATITLDDEKGKVVATTANPPRTEYNETHASTMHEWASVAVVKTVFNTKHF